MNLLEEFKSFKAPGFIIKLVEKHLKRTNNRETIKQLFKENKQ